MDKQQAKKSRYSALVLRKRKKEPSFMSDPIIICNNLTKIYKVADLEVVALQKLNLEVAPGEMLTIAGASGSGKSTLLNILGGLDIPSAGICLVDDQDLTCMTSTQRINYRRNVVGQIWRQSGRNLLPELSVQSNVELPQILKGIGATQRATRARELLTLVGLSGKERHKPEQLSGGERQRNAIAVALANQPKILLADEPTDELAGDVAEEIFALFHSLNKAFGLTIIIATHQPAATVMVNRTIAISDGHIGTNY
jgi:ABC-type lipoprotein export system ATPase subunit